jgi:hypothetical protein
MDLDPAIRYLRAEVDKLDRVIASLEKLLTEPGPPLDAPGKRRGRKSMGAEERLEVSARMKRYWAKRRRGPK